MIPPLKKDGASEITSFVEFEPNSSNKFSTNGWELVGDKYLKTSSKVDDIIILPNYKQIKSTNRLEITFPITDKATRPIVFENISDDYYGYDNKLFLDMVNKELIT